MVKCDKIQRSQHWLCYLHVKCNESVSRIIQHYGCLFSEVVSCDLFDFMLFSILINPPFMIKCQKISVFFNIQISLLILILCLASGSSKTRRISQKLYKSLDSISAWKVYLHLYIDNSCIVWRLLKDIFYWFIFTFWVMLFWTKTGIVYHVLCFNLSRNAALIQPFSIMNEWTTNETYE